MAGLVLGVESVPDGLASGLLAGVNPVSGMYAYLYGVVGGVLFTSTAFMAVQGTGAMAIIVADVDLISRDDPARALFTLSMMTGAVMILAGLLRLGSFLRFVSNSVMTGFITAVGINIVLGQLDDFTGYAAEGGNRVSRAFDLVLHFWRIELATTLVGAVTIVLIVWLQRTRLGAARSGDCDRRRIGACRRLQCVRRRGPAASWCGLLVPAERRICAGLSDRARPDGHLTPC